MTVNDVDPVSLIVVSFTAYKLASLVAGVASSYMGYRLFIAGIWGQAGDLSAEYGKTKLVLTRAAPGTFFAVLGAVIICVALFKGEGFDWSAACPKAPQSQPHLPE
jgi:hypothetical protein